MGTKKLLGPLINRENRICELAIGQLKEKCKHFEEKYKISSTDFYKRFQDGEIGDEQDYFEWKSLIEGTRSWLKTKDGLKELTK